MGINAKSLIVAGKEVSKEPSSPRVPRGKRQAATINAGNLIIQNGEKPKIPEATDAPQPSAELLAKRQERRAKTDRETSQYEKDAKNIS